MTAPAAEAWRRADRWVTRAHAVGCTCTVDIEPPCLCRCHGPARALLDLAIVLRARSTQFATVPNGPLLWGRDKPRVVRCHACGSVLRPGTRGPVTRERAGWWRHGRASGGCDRRERVPRDGRTLERLLRKSVEVSRG
jgi:hypothetical protein